MSAPSQQQMSGPHFDCLGRCTKIEVREKVSLFEAATALMGQEVEMANKYKVVDENGEQIFYAVEGTGCCNMQIKQCAPDCAPWDVDILYTEGNNAQKAFKMERPFTCAFLCFNRPVVEILDPINGGQKVGSIKDPCHCCNDDFVIRDADDNDLYNVSSGCCQLGKFCPLPCGPCALVEFSIIDAVNGGTVGSVTKKIPGCCKFFFASDVDNYRIDFGNVNNARDKALIMALSIFIDFRLYSDNSADEQTAVE